MGQWTRAKSCDTFGVCGPSIETEVDRGKLVVKTILDGQERQHYPLSDIVFSPEKLVSLISRDMTLESADGVPWGSSGGVGAMAPRAPARAAWSAVCTVTNKVHRDL